MLQCLLLYFQSLQEAFSRCVAVLSHSSKPDDMAVQVTLTNSTLLSTERHMDFSLLFQKCLGWTITHNYGVSALGDSWPICGRFECICKTTKLNYLDGRNISQTFPQWVGFTLFKKINFAYFLFSIWWWMYIERCTNFAHMEKSKKLKIPILFFVHNLFFPRGEHHLRTINMLA